MAVLRKPRGKVMTPGSYASLEIDEATASAVLSAVAANTTYSWTVQESQDWLITNTHTSGNLFFSYSTDPGGTAAQRQIAITPGASMKIRINDDKTLFYYASDVAGTTGLAQVVF